MAVRSRKTASNAQNGADTSMKTSSRDTPEREESTDVSFEEKIALIDQEIRTIHHFFVSKGFTPLEVERGARPLLDSVSRAGRKRCALKLGKLAVFFLVGWGLFHYDPAYHVMLTTARIANVKFVLPYWDWNFIYERACVVHNPYFVGSKIRREDCEICYDLETMPRVANISPSDMREHYMNRDVPVIVTDATSDWPAMEKFSIESLEEIFTKTPSMRDYTGCYFASNVRSVNGNNKLFLKKAAGKLIKNYYAHWENCMIPVSKGLRAYYRRPYFLPESSELNRESFIFVSSDYKGRNFKPVALEAAFMWYAQIKGSSQVKALPKAPCNHTCPGVIATINEGEIMLLTGRIWFLDYLPNSPGENIAIATGGIYDYNEQ